MPITEAKHFERGRLNHRRARASSASLGIRSERCCACLRPTTRGKRPPTRRICGGFDYPKCACRWQFGHTAVAFSIVSSPPCAS